MNKKVTAIVGTVALGSLLLGASAYAAVSTTSGYDVYKQAIKNTVAATSMAPTTKITVKDNGNLLLTASAATKLNTKTKAMSNDLSVTVGGKTQTVDLYQQAGKLIVKSGDSAVYNVRQEGKRGGPGGENWKQDAEQNGQHNSKQTAEQRAANKAAKEKDMENIVDAFSTNIQNFMTSTVNSDGTTAVSLKMSDSQISPVVNAVASVFVKNAVNDKFTGEQSQGLAAGGETGLNSLMVKELQGKLPQLVSNIKVNAVQVDATVSTNNLITGQKENLTISGTDSNGQNHEIVISVDTAVSGYNNTTPDTVDLTGKQVKEIVSQRGHGFDRGEGKE